MVIAVDTTHPHRRPLELRALVETVHTAHPADEAGWVEWKSQLDLTAPAGAFVLAKAILGLSNRMPDVADKTCGGLAYVLVGVEPGNLPGTPAIDGADLEQALLRYLGADGPAWSPHYVTVNSVTVLVVIVEAPRWGDQIHTLRKQYDKHGDGTVFVRSQSRSRPATSAEIRMLSDRMTRGLSSAHELSTLEVTCATSEPGGLLVIDPPPDAVEAWLTQRRAALTEWLKTLTGSPNSILPRAQIGSADIDEHLQLCRARLFDAQRRRVFEVRLSVLTVAVRTVGAHVLEDVDLTLHLDGFAWSAQDVDSDDHQDIAGLPPPPQLRTVQSLMSNVYGLRTQVRAPTIPYFNPNIEIEPPTITLDMGQVRPGRAHKATAFSLLLHGEPHTPDAVSIPWEATSVSTTGIQRGVLQVPVDSRRLLLIEPHHGIPPGNQSR